MKLFFSGELMRFQLFQNVKRIRLSELLKGTNSSVVAAAVLGHRNLQEVSQMKFQQRRQGHCDSAVRPHSPRAPTQRQRGFGPGHELGLCLHGDEPGVAGGRCRDSCSHLQLCAQQHSTSLCRRFHLYNACAGIYSVGINFCEEL